ncbi:MAG: hypothetical protein ACR2H1_09500, partial [Limisphaerales bacterium]
LHAHLPAAEIISLLENKVSSLGRVVSRKEIVDAVQSSLPCAWGPTKGATISKPQSKWPTVDEGLRAKIIRDHGGLADLWELSKPRIDDNEQRTEQIIDRLFPGNPLLCCGKSSSDFDTRPREEWRGELSKLQLIVPSQMSAETGLTKDGRESKHTLNNTGDRRFLVCEFDRGTTDDHAGLLLHLAQYAPLVCVVHSGGKSLHGWFLVPGQPDDKVTKFFRYAVSIGADPATWTKSQFVRTPDGERDSGKRQTVYFLNFKVLEAKR